MRLCASPDMMQPVTRGECSLEKKCGVRSGLPKIPNEQTGEEKCD